MTWYPAASTAAVSSGKSWGWVMVRAAVFLARLTSAVTPGSASSAALTRPTQWLHIMPSICRVTVCGAAGGTGAGALSCGSRVHSTAVTGGTVSTAGSFGFQPRSRRALLTTHTEERLMAAEASMGLNFQPRAT